MFVISDLYFSSPNSNFAKLFKNISCWSTDKNEVIYINLLPSSEKSTLFNTAYNNNVIISFHYLTPFDLAYYNQQ